MDVSENSGFSPQIIHLIGFSIIFTIHFGGTSILGNPHIFQPRSFKRWKMILMASLLNRRNPSRLALWSMAFETETDGWEDEALMKMSFTILFQSPKLNKKNAVFFFTKDVWWKKGCVFWVIFCFWKPPKKSAKKTSPDFSSASFLQWATGPEIRQWWGSPSRMPSSSLRVAPSLVLWQRWMTEGPKGSKLIRIKIVPPCTGKVIANLPRNQLGIYYGIEKGQKTSHWPTWLVTKKNWWTWIWFFGPSE